ncbi:metallophosphoesterase family protein [Sulfoacidibacillus thermotolerans]|uniref:metallophosphoesterase family protein n=1 Tax=Sulfoacidibacillus thermotolerans TaxID=1765684 RepID=UPI001C633103|nr:metallophosphoesterase [Sulfoacidibacillus thermotolerans]
MAKGTRLFYTSDIHGSERCFLKFLNTAKFYQANVLVLGGDITGKVVVPLISRGNAYEARFLGQTHEAHTNEELMALEKAIRFNGFYPLRVTQEEYDDLTADAKKQETLFNRLVAESLERWMDMAEERLKGLGVRCFINPGNDDEWIVDEILAKSNFVENHDGGVVQIDDDHEMLVVGHSNTTPFNSPREMSEEDLSHYMSEVSRKLKFPQRAIFTLHVPPYGSGLDNAPLLREHEVVTRGGHTVMTPVGSTAVRATIEQFQPQLGLHGHVHESRGVKKIGRTLCLNPGSEYSEGILHGALVSLTRDKVVGYQLVTA